MFALCQSTSHSDREGYSVIRINKYAQKSLPSAGAEKHNYGVVAISDISQTE